MPLTSDAKRCELLGQIKNMMHIAEEIKSAAALENVMAELTECNILLCAASARTWKRLWNLLLDSMHTSNFTNFKKQLA